MSYMTDKKPLSGSLTIRLSAELRRRLKREAHRKGQRPSDVARQLIAEGLDSSAEEVSLGERTGHLLGSINSQKVVFGRAARRALRDWNPDRRG